MSKTESQVEELLTPIIENLGYDLYDVIFEKEGKDYYLRIVIDKLEGIDIKDCEKVNDAINDILDEEDLIKEQYFLEVSSPGIERSLRREKHFKDNLEKEVLVKLYRPFNKKREYTGILKNFENSEITLECNNEIIKFNLKDIVSVNTVFNFEGGY